ncbi:ThiF family adenylyltransferase [Chitinophaga caseinilytica]|uniref:ThiF family adenylyltransferase n=1 Tax=Chitinophaga caseinilytica TaxID=2267521 RepID=UPI003C2C86A1
MTLKERIQETQSAPITYTPVFFYPDRAADQAALQQLLEAQPYIRVYDELAGQLRELVKVQHPTRRLSEAETVAAVEAHLNGVPQDQYGVWVFYPWTAKLVHLLGKEEFIALRTSRNMHKITAAERDALQEKKIGVIGLSVGQTIALTLAMERVCGELRLADFDDVELTNMNRLRTTVDNLGMPKVIVAAREIVEMDPYIQVKVYLDGATEANLDDFLTGGGKLDILVEECDGVDVKILSRQKARKHRIPVVMDTNDRGMLDIERFDLDPEYPLLHGLIPPIEDLGMLKHLSNEEKIPILGPMAGMADMSPRMKYSLGEIGKTITTWPQLASSVMLGGALVTDTCRRILLDQLKSSGRYYVDFDQLIQ